MRKILLVLFCLLSLNSMSQTMNISGTVIDTASGTPVQNALATAIRIKDSILVAFTRTDASGRFQLKALPVDTVQVTVSSPKTGDQAYYVFGSAANRDFDFGKIILPPKSQLLNEVVIYAFKDPVYYKGDTLIYTADSFKVKPNATVEDLLKKLPGIKVDAQGKITSQGKEVSQVLVDGDEFFGADPTVATKNLAAQGVESVQVYEKKNENATEGGEETIQVMDLKMKEDAKKGYFGKISAASDFQDFHEGEILANKFKGSQKISVFALGSNTPRSGFGWGDMYKYGLNNEMSSFSDDDGNMYWNNNDDAAQGIPKTFKAGIYYNDKIGKNTKFGFNYTYNSNELKASGSTRSQFYLSDTNYVTDEQNTNLQRSEGHNLNFIITQKLDSLTDLVIEPKFKLNTNDQSSYNQTKFLTSYDSLSHQTDVSNSNEAKGYNINATARLTRRFKKRDRMFRLNYNFIMNDDQSEGLLKSNNTFYDSTQLAASIDQKKTNSSNSQTHNATAIYTEPLSKKIKLEFEYNYNSNIGIQDKKAQNFVNGEYSVYDSALTNNFENSKITNRFGAKFIYEVKKQSFNFGAKARNVSIVNSNLITDQQIKQSVNNILPFLGYMYRFSDNSRFNLRYTTNSSQPSLNQLQPIPDNSNPNQVRIGNPDLLPTYSHNFNASFNTYKPLSGKYIWCNGNFSITDNAFANATTYDSIGRTISQTVNVDGNYNANVNIGGGLPVFNRMLQINPNFHTDYNSYSGFINGKKNITETVNMNAEMELTLELDTLEFSFGYNYDYTIPRSTLSTAGNKPYSDQQFSADLTLRLPFKMLLETEVEYNIAGQRAAGYNINYVLWHASISKAFLKNENFIITLSGNDLLNQNISNKRTVQDNVITDTKTNIISRYFLLRLTYKFNSTKTKDNDEFGW
ncbi:MAG TPA: outer membrane beta-barrel family protein [Bacteroidia bacterium]|jgi:5-hydroxyisourate hydrolase-like protein (transthyretin family)